MQSGVRSYLSCTRRPIEEKVGKIVIVNQIRNDADNILMSDEIF